MPVTDVDTRVWYYFKRLVDKIPWNNGKDPSFVLSARQQ